MFKNDVATGLPNSGNEVHGKSATITFESTHFYNNQSGKFHFDMQIWVSTTNLGNRVNGCGVGSSITTPPTNVTSCQSSNLVHFAAGAGCSVSLPSTSSECTWQVIFSVVNNFSGCESACLSGQGGCCGYCSTITNSLALLENPDDPCICPPRVYRKSNVFCLTLLQHQFQSPNQLHLFPQSRNL